MLRLLIAACAVCVVAGSGTAPATLRAPAQRPIPARLLGSGVPVPVPPALLRVRNGWLASDGRSLVAVYAGAAGNDPGIGRLVIVRQDLLAGRQAVRTIDAGRTGALAIAAAPLGRSVETSAQTGSLLLRTAGGGSLRLALATGTVAAVDPSGLTKPTRNAGTVPRPWRPHSSDEPSYSIRR